MSKGGRGLRKVVEEAGIEGGRGGGGGERRGSEWRSKEGLGRWR